MVIGVSSSEPHLAIITHKSAMKHENKPYKFSHDNKPPTSSYPKTSLYVTEFANRGLMHSSNLSTLRMCNSASTGPSYSFEMW